MLQRALFFTLCRYFSKMSSKLSILHILFISATVVNCYSRPMRASTDTLRNSGPIAFTSYGRVKGLKHFLPSLSRTVDAFMGIPFAKPPVGHLRFALPQPPERWTYVYNATKIPTPCWQLNDTYFGNDFRGSNMWNPLSAPSEDCLYLNVYVPKPAQSTAPSSNKMSSRSNKLAVMVWIYGGGFYSGSSYLDVYDGKYLAVTSDTIVVTVNYRLGALGFLTLKDPLTPPNVGLYDQLMSLEWIRNNIAFFGGDPDNITIFGESAGAVSVSLHLLSPLSHDKFHRAIMQSGTANMPWGVIPMLEAQKRATEFVKLLGCAETKEAEIADIAQAMNCMKSMPAKAIVDYQWVTRNIMQFPFIPVIDGVFVPDDPVKLLERREFKKCPILIGSNANEASFFIIYELDSQFNLTWKSMTRDDYSTSLTKLFFYYPQYPINMPYRGLEAVKFQYTPWSDLDDVDKNIYALDMAVSDSQFICPLNIFARSYSSAGQDVYAYYFTQRIKNHVWPEWMGVLHGDEILFMFSEVTKWKNNYTYEEQELSKKMILYWSNFAKTGWDCELTVIQNFISCFDSSVTF